MQLCNYRIFYIDLKGPNKSKISYPMITHVEFKKRIQMNVLTKEKQTHRHRKCVVTKAEVGGGGWPGGVGWADAQHHIWNRWSTGICCIEGGNLNNR